MSVRVNKSYFSYERERRALAGEKRETTRSRASSNEGRFRVLPLKKPYRQVEDKKKKKKRKKKKKKTITQ